MSRLRSARSGVFGILLLLLAVGCSQQNNQPNNSTPSPVTPTPPAPQSLQVWTNSFNGVPFTMVGTDPSVANSGATQVSTLIVPVELNFGGVLITPEEVACGDTEPAMERVLNSPIFTNGNWLPTVFPTANSQFGDAFQRANFWALVGTKSPNYHILLSPYREASPITINVPPIQGASYVANPICPGQFYGSVPQAFMESSLQQAFQQIGASPNMLVVFITYDTEFPLSGGGLFLGYHNNVGGQTYLVASYMDAPFSQLFGIPGAVDTSILSHEVGEWINNPLLVNNVPPWGGFGIQTSCGTELEVGDPLTGYIAGYTDQTGFTYHLQELAYFSWFARNSPSLAFDGRYSTLGTFTTFAPPCTTPPATRTLKTLEFRNKGPVISKPVQLPQLNDPSQ